MYYDTNIVILTGRILSHEVGEKSLNFVLQNKTQIGKFDVDNQIKCVTFGYTKDFLAKVLVENSNPKVLAKGLIRGGKYTYNGKEAMSRQINILEVNILSSNIDYQENNQPF